MSLHESKSLLAKLMATEDLIIRQAKVPTASFNVQTRVLTVPILDQTLSKDVYDLFMGHEVGHALYTPLEGVKKALEQKIDKDVLNIVDDSRIERRIKTRYPGIKAPFVRAYNDLYEKNFFGTKGQDINEYNFIDRINLHCKIGASLAIKFTEKERELLNEVETTETYDDVIEVSKKIIEFMNLPEQQAQETLKVAVLVDAADGSDESQDKEETKESLEDFDVVIDAREEKENTDSSDDKSEKEDDEQEKTEGFEETEENDGDGSQEPEELPGSVASSGASRDENDDTPPEIRSLTDEAYKQREQELFDKNNSEFVYVNVPKYDTKYGLFDYKEVYKMCDSEGFNIPTSEFVEFRRDSLKVVSYLVKEFELRKNADQMKRASTSKTGDLDLSKIYSFNFNDDIFKKITVVPNGQSHGLVMFLDWSGSMSRHIGNTVKQLLNLVMFCKKVNIPYEVYSFIEHTHNKYMYQPTPKTGDLYCGKFGMVNLLSSRMTANEFIKGASAMMVFGGLSKFYRNRPNVPTFLRMSGTPLNECIIAAMEIVPEFQKKHRLQIVNTVFLTDGEGSSLFDSYETMYPSRLNFTHMVIRDPKTRHEEIFDRTSYKNWSDQLMGQTDCLIRLLKHRTNSHVIGFFVCDTKDLTGRMSSFYPKVKTETQKEIIKDKFRKDSYSVVTSTGFDDYYLLRSSGLDTDDEEELEFKENATTRGMVSAFSKYAANKVSSRVVLNRFIGLIS